MICPNCKANLKDDAKFCTKCGSPIPRCPTCGKLLTKRVPFCTEDGTPIPEEILSLIPYEYETPADYAPADDTPQSFCTKCGQPCNYGESLCESCKNEARQSEPPQQNNNEQQPPVPPKKKGSGIIPLIIIIAVLFAVLAGLAAYAWTTNSLPFLSGSNTVSEEDKDDDKDKDDEEDEDSDRESRRRNSSDDEDDDKSAEDEEEDTTKKRSSRERTTEGTTEDEETTKERTTRERTTERTTREATTEATTEVTTLSDIEYFIVNSDKMYFSEDYFSDFDANMCRLARNGIYAYEGRKFNDSSLQSYFEQYDWYTPLIDPDDFKESMFNQYQIANKDLIVSYESKKGYN